MLNSLELKWARLTWRVFRIFWRFFKKAFQNPGKIGRKEVKINIFRQLILKPVIFDLLSLFFQLRDYLRILKIKNNNFQKSEYMQKVYDYNFGVTVNKEITTTRRFETLYRIACSSTISSPEKDQLLIIGPRNISEFLIAWGYGYYWKNIIGIDLYSMNSKIMVMNAEKLTFSNHYFNVVIISNMICYSKDVYQILLESYRVLKDRGILVFNHSYTGKGAWQGNHIHNFTIEEMLKKIGFKLYFNEFFIKKKSLGQITEMTYFGAVKKLKN